MDLQNRLKLVIKESGLSIPDFAKKLGVAGSTLVNYRDGRTSPTVDLLMKICEEFLIHPKWLLLGEGPMRLGDEATEEDTGTRWYINLDLLRRILSVIKRRQAIRGTTMPPDKEAEMIALIYEYYFQALTFPDEQTMEQTVERFLRLVA